MAVADYYSVLGVERDATEEEIKRAYRKMSRKYHPDLAGPQFEEKFKEVNTAYEVLSDPEKRRMFDMGVDPNDPRGGAGYGGGQPFGGFDMGDVFGQFFDAFGGGTGNGPIPRSQPGRDQLEELTIDLKTAVFGAEQHLKFSTYGTCQNCEGTGSEHEEPPITCPTCHGSGYTQKVVRTLLGQMMTSVPCGTCQGHGNIFQHPCTQCQGSGRVRTERDVVIPVPGGVQNDSRLRVPGQGEAGKCNGQPGDLYVDITVRKDERFTRQGDDLHCWIHVPMTWAVLGHAMEIDSFDGKQQLDIPAGTQPEQTVELKNLGMTKLNDKDQRGNLIVHINVQIPTKLSDSERSLMEEFAQQQKDEKPVRQSSQPATPQKKGFFSKIKDALG